MAITVYNSKFEKLLLDENPVATPGGEGSVHRIIATPNYSDYCVKIYHTPKRTFNRRQKIEFMIKNKPLNIITSNYKICFPTELAFDTKKNFIGFIMPLAFPGSEKLYELTTTKISPRLSKEWHKFERTSLLGFEKRLKVCVNIAISVHALHQTKKFAIVDYKPQNILITSDGKISITDVDSFQISDNGQVLHHSEVATPEYAPPECLRINPSLTFVPESWDTFSLAVSFYEILYGIHPYTSTCDGQYFNVTTIGEKIQKGLFVHGSKKSYLTVIPPLHNDFQRLPFSIRQLFIKAFEDGHTNPKMRPSSEEWGNKIFQELEAKGSIQPNIVSIASVKKQISGSPKLAPLRPAISNTKQNPAQAKNSNRNLNHATKKEDYMIWKFLTAILALVIFAFYVSSDQTQDLLKKSREQQLLLESDKASLLSRISQLESTQSSNEAELRNEIGDLKSNLNSVAKYFPIVITSISFNNVDNSGTILNPNFNQIEKSKAQYIQPQIKYNCLSEYEEHITLYYKIYDSEGNLISDSNSPLGFTWYKEIDLPGNSSKDNFSFLNACQIGCPFSCATGKYIVEFWCNGNLLNKSSFEITE